MSLLEKAFTYLYTQREYYESRLPKTSVFTPDFINIHNSLIIDFRNFIVEKALAVARTNKLTFTPNILNTRFKAESKDFPFDLELKAYFKTIPEIIQSGINEYCKIFADPHYDIVSSNLEEVDKMVLKFFHIKLLIPVYYRYQYIDGSPEPPTCAGIEIDKTSTNIDYYYYYFYTKVLCNIKKYNLEVQAILKDLKLKNTVLTTGDSTQPQPSTQPQTIQEKIPEVLRKILWNTYIGTTTTGLCLCCGVDHIMITNFEYGFLSDLDGNTIENIRPICRECHIHIHTNTNMNMNQFMEKYKIKRQRNWNGI